MKTTKCKVCGSTDVTVTVTVNPNDILPIAEYCHNDESITEDGWCNDCCEYVEFENSITDDFKTCVPSLMDRTTLYFKCHRKDDGSFTDWYVIERLPKNWPEGTTTNFYHKSDNKLYLIPDDSARYYEMADGVLCIRCNSPIDKTTVYYIENRMASRIDICKTCSEKMSESGM